MATERHEYLSLSPIATERRKYLSKALWLSELDSMQWYGKTLSRWRRGPKRQHPPLVCRKSNSLERTTYSFALLQSPSLIAFGCPRLSLQDMGEVELKVLSLLLCIAVVVGIHPDFCVAGLVLVPSCASTTLQLATSIHVSNTGSCVIVRQDRDKSTTLRHPCSTDERAARAHNDTLTREYDIVRTRDGRRCAE